MAGGLTCPIEVTNAGDNSGRLFVIDQTGKILIIQNGQVLPTAFLDISSLLVTENAGYDERGLLGLAFHPDYIHNGRFFVRYSVPRTGTPDEPCTNSPPFGCHMEVLAEFHVSANPNIADPNGTVLLTINKPQFNHNSGEVAFGPDGFLYFGMGDGGGANDGLTDTPPSHGPIGSGQNTNVMLGKLHRIDVSTPGTFSSPPTNPFATGGGLPSIYAYGFRNPYRFSFDNRPGGDGTLYMADVGQDNVEEVDIVQNGGNYGWVIREGATCFDPFHTTTPFPTCNDAGLIDPIAEYFHDVGIAVVGGYLYRGSGVPAMQGKYVFGDFSTSFGAPDGHVFYMTPVNGSLASQILRPRLGVHARSLGLFLKGIGRDQQGEKLYFCGFRRTLGPSGQNGVGHPQDGRRGRAGVRTMTVTGMSGPTRTSPPFFACLSGAIAAPPARRTSTAMESIGTDSDIEAFFRVLGGGPC